HRGLWIDPHPTAPWDYRHHHGATPAGSSQRGIAPLAPFGRAERGVVQRGKRFPRPVSAKPNGGLSNEGTASLAPFGKAERGPTPCGRFARVRARGPEGFSSCRARS